MKLQWKERCENGGCRLCVFDELTRNSDEDHSFAGISYANTEVDYSYNCAFMSKRVYLNLYAAVIVWL